MAVSFRKFRVVKKVAESSIITSFHLEPEDGLDLWPARPGQYLTFRIPTNIGPVTRAYSLSGDTQDRRQYRISVKREMAPGGRGSRYLHDEIYVGDLLDVAAPRGAFVLDRQSLRPVLLLSGGVGLTPMISMLYALQKSDRRVWFVHACECGAVQAFADEIAVLRGAANDRIRTHMAFRVPKEEGLQALLPLDDYDVYLCGPTPFMAAMYQNLRELGVAKDRLHYEFFGDASSLEGHVDPRAKPKMRNSKPTVSDEKMDEGNIEVVFAKSGITVAWDGSVASLLDLAEEAGLMPEFGCRGGICNSCSYKLVEGKVIYFDEPMDKPDADKVLICCARPAGRIVLDL